MVDACNNGVIYEPCPELAKFVGIDRRLFVDLDKMKDGAAATANTVATGANAAGELAKKAAITTCEALDPFAKAGDDWVEDILSAEMPDMQFGTVTISFKEN